MNNVVKTSTEALVCSTVDVFLMAICSESNTLKQTTRVSLVVAAGRSQGDSTFHSEILPHGPRTWHEDVERKTDAHHEHRQPHKGQTSLEQLLSRLL